MFYRIRFVNEAQRMEYLDSTQVDDKGVLIFAAHTEITIVAIVDKLCATDNPAWIGTFEAVDDSNRVVYSNFKRRKEDYENLADRRWEIQGR